MPVDDDHPGICQMYTLRTPTKTSFLTITSSFPALYIVLLEMMMNVETDSFATNDIMNTPESSRKKNARTISSSLIIVLLVTSCIIWSIFSSSGSGSSLKAPSQRRMLREYGPDYRPIMHTFCK